MDEQIDDMLQQGVIQPSKSPWNSPLFLVPKKDGQFRPVIDFRKDSEVTEDDRFPLPVLSDLLMSLGHGNKFFSSLDLLSGYWQVPFAPESREITALSTPNGTLNGCVCPLVLNLLLSPSRGFFFLFPVFSSLFLVLKVCLFSDVVPWILFSHRRIFFNIFF